MIVIQRNRYMLPPDKRDAAAADEAEKQLVPKLKIMEAHLAQHRHFAGAAWGLADFMVASVCYSMWINKFTLLEQFPKFMAWLTASVERPAAREARKLRE